MNLLWHLPETDCFSLLVHQSGHLEDHGETRTIAAANARKVDNHGIDRCEQAFGLFHQVRNGVKTKSATDKKALFLILIGAYDLNCRRGSIVSLHYSPGSREQAQHSCSKAPLWSEKRSHSYGLSEEQAYGREDQPEP
jgi:hypothetical protein